MSHMREKRTFGNANSHERSSHEKSDAVSPILKKKSKVHTFENKMSDVSPNIFDVSSVRNGTVVYDKKTDDGKYFNPELLKIVMSIEKMDPKNSTERAFVSKAKKLMAQIKDRIVSFIMMLMPQKKGAKFVKNTLDPQSQKALDDFKVLAALYEGMYLDSDAEKIAHEFGTGKTFYDLLEHSRSSGFDEGYVTSKMQDYIRAFEPA